MSTVSENGWPLVDLAGTELTHAAGAAFRLHPGDVAATFAEFITEYDDQVEPVEGGVPDDWSWADRPVRGQSTVWSNHYSATAVDLNAVRHARGAVRTFSPDALGALTALLARYPVLRWGGRFSTVVDPMHFEIAVPAAPLAAWRASRATTSTPGDEMLVIAKLPTSDEVFVGNGITRRKVADVGDLQATQALLRARGGDPTILVTRDLRALGEDLTWLLRAER